LFDFSFVCSVGEIPSPVAGMSWRLAEEFQVSEDFMRKRLGFENEERQK